MRAEQSITQPAAAPGVVNARWYCLRRIAVFTLRDARNFFRSWHVASAAFPRRRGAVARASMFLNHRSLQLPSPLTCKIPDHGRNHQLHELELNSWLPGGVDDSS